MTIQIVKLIVQHTEEIANWLKVLILEAVVYKALEILKVKILIRYSKSTIEILIQYLIEK